jgi:hypothetical protein
MALRYKIDSNETGLSWAEELTPGVLPVTPTWRIAEPNEYDDLGGELTLLSRRPINSSRQRKKGNIVDLDASGGFNQDFTIPNTMDLMQGFMYASHRKKLNVTFTSVTVTGYVVADESLFAAGMLIFVEGSEVPGNNGLKLVTSVDAGSSEVRVAGLAVDAAPGTDALITLVGVEAASGDVDVDATGTLPALTSTTLDFTDYGFIPGEHVFVGGDGATAFAGEANNGLKRIFSIAAQRLTFDKSDLAMVTEASANVIRIFFGHVLKNELAGGIVRRTYQLERTLGAPELSTPNNFQAEYIRGAYPNEANFQIEVADKINIDFSFVALDVEYRDHTEGLKSGNRPTLVEKDCFNTSTDFARIRMYSYVDGNEAPTPVFPYFEELEVTINNNVSLNKAVGVLGGFDATLGLFEVGFECSGYFQTVAGQRAIRDNLDFTFDWFVVKDNAGFVMDMPMVAMSTEGNEVELDEAIKMPLTGEAASGAKYSPNMDHTLLLGNFVYLPTLAEELGDY